MVSNPAQWVDDMADAGVDRFTFHVEATDEPKKVIDAVKAKGMKVGMALKPGTPVEAVLPFCDDLVSELSFMIATL
jgi:ribulose-phosphate 3-epimerase